MLKIIEIDLDNKFEYLSKFNDNVISSDLCKYILDSLDDVKFDVLLKVNFNYEITDKELSLVEELFKKSFLWDLNNIQKQLKKQRLIDFGLLIWGMLILIIYLNFKKYDFILITEFLMIISWVSLWRVVESILFERRRLFINKKKYEKLMKAKIEILS